MSTKFKLILLSFLQFAVWGAYLTSQGRYLAGIGLAEKIGLFYAVQGVVSIFMPAIIGIIADKWVPAQRLLGICHLVSGAFIIGAGYYGYVAGTEVEFTTLFALYTAAVAFYMPTIGLSNSVAYTVLEKSGLDVIKSFPPIRIWGTVGFICAMLISDFTSFQDSSLQYVLSGGIGLLLGLYCFALPHCPVAPKGESKSFAESFGLSAFKLFKDYRTAVFFVFSMLLGVALQITNGFANPFLADFGLLPEFEGAFGVEHSNMLISISQMSETLCILLIPFFLKRFGIKVVMLMAMFAWVLRFALFGLGDPGNGVWLLIVSMIVYGIAFDFFNISGSLFLDNNVDKSIRSSAQGLFMLMTNGVGATVGTLAAQEVVNKYVLSQTEIHAKMAGWDTAWYIFAAYALVVMVLFALMFRYKHTKQISKY